MTTSHNITNRVDLLERAISSLDVPKSVCQMEDGTIDRIEGLSVIAPFLEGKIKSVVCDNPDVANLLRAMDSENHVKIEIAYQCGDYINREEI